jgi:hypothetical protein
MSDTVLKFALIGGEIILPLDAMQELAGVASVRSMQGANILAWAAIPIVYEITGALDWVSGLEHPRTKEGVRT